MPGGCPTKYKPEYCEQSEKLVALGATDKQIGDFFEVTEQTINNWKIAHPEFFESLKLSKEQLDSRVVRSLYERAMGYSHEEEKVFNNQGEILTHDTVKHYPPDPTAMIFWLKNRQPDQWRDKREITGADGKDLIPEYTDTEIQRRVAFILMSETNSEH